MTEMLRANAVAKDFDKAPLATWLPGPAVCHTVLKDQNWI